MKEAMQVRKDMVGVGCESLMRMFDTNDECLVEQVCFGHFLSHFLIFLIQL